MYNIAAIAVVIDRGSCNRYLESLIDFVQRYFSTQELLNKSFRKRA